MSKGWKYFAKLSNKFDFIVVLGNLIISIGNYSSFHDLSILRIYRLYRLGKILRVYKLAKNFRKLISALISSFSELAYVGCLLLMIIYIYAIIGMTLFGQLKPTGVLDDVTNFATFERSILLLIRLTTCGGWNDVLSAMLLDDDCNKTHYFVNNIPKPRPGGECGDTTLSIVYMVSFIFISFFVVTNMYIAIILENYMMAHEYEERGVSEDDIFCFYVTWSNHDPCKTEFISLDYLPYFVADLDEPLGIPFPNEAKIDALNLPIVDYNDVHCFDVMKALVLRVIGNVEQNETFFEMEAQIEMKFRKIFPNRSKMNITNRLIQFRKEQNACRTIQRGWRYHIGRRMLRRITNKSMYFIISPSSDMTL